MYGYVSRLFYILQCFSLGALIARLFNNSCMPASTLKSARKQVFNVSADSPYFQMVFSAKRLAEKYLQPGIHA